MSMDELYTTNSLGVMARRLACLTITGTMRGFVVLQPPKNLESENASFGLARQREEEYLDIATNDNAVSVKLALSHRAGLWNPRSLLAHLDVEPPHLRYAALPRNPTDPLILNF